MCRRSVWTMAAVAFLALAGGPAGAITIPVPNGEFSVYKPGTNPTVTGTFVGGAYASGVGNNVAVKSGSVNFSDGPGPLFPGGDRRSPPL